MYEGSILKSPGKNFIAMVISDDESGSGDNMVESDCGENGTGLKKRDLVDGKHEKCKNKDKERKRWSFMSSYSSNGSESSQKSSSSKKRISISSNRNSLEGGSKITLKRSSTGSSLKHMFNKINISDENSNENRIKHSPGFFNKSIKNNQFETIERTPLAPVINGVTQSNKKANAKDNFKKPSNLYLHKPISSISDMSSITSSSSTNKWKFWKNDNQLSRSVSSQSVALNQQKGNPQIRDRKLKKKSSISSLFSSARNTNTKNSGIEVDSKNNQNNNSLRKIPSTSNLSISHLKHKTSHSSLKNLKIRRKTSSAYVHDAETALGGKNQISLPTPDAASRNKINTKLQNSNSLMSLHSYVSSVPVLTSDYKSIILNHLLEHCNYKYILDDEEINELGSSVYSISSNKQQLTDYIYRYTDSKTSESIICKKLSIDVGDSGFYTPELCLHELICLRACENTMGLPLLLQSYIYREIVNESEKLYLMIFLKDSGSALQSITLSDWQQATSIFWQCTTVLYVAETKLSFEHRNLNVNNILVDTMGNITICDFKGCRLTSKFDKQVLFTRLDNPIFYQGGKDYQYEIYEMMRNTLPTPSAWSSFEPRTNLMWLHYLINELLKKGQASNVPDSDALQNLLKISDILNQSITGTSQSGINSSGDLLRLKNLF